MNQLVPFTGLASAISGGGTGVTSALATLFWSDQRWDFGKLRPVPPDPRTIPPILSLNHLWVIL